MDTRYLKSFVAVVEDDPPSREDVIRERAQQSGCAAFSWKPIDGNTLAATIASLANR